MDHAGSTLRPLKRLTGIHNQVVQGTEQVVGNQSDAQCLPADLDLDVGDTAMHPRLGDQPRLLGRQHLRQVHHLFTRGLGGFESRLLLLGKRLGAPNRRAQTFEALPQPLFRGARHASGKDLFIRVPAEKGVEFSENPAELPQQPHAKGHGLVHPLGSHGLFVRAAESAQRTVDALDGGAELACGRGVSPQLGSEAR